VKKRKSAPTGKAAGSPKGKKKATSGPSREGRALQGEVLQSLADLAAEIRDPINTLQTVNRSLLETPLTPVQREFTEKSLAEADSLLTLVNDLLDYSRIEGRNFTLARMDFDLRTTLEDTVHLLSARAREKGLVLGLLVHHEVPSLLIGDPGRLRQILIHFTNFALHRTTRGEVLIQVTLESETPTRAMVHFAIMNSGPGLSPVRRACFFEFPPRRGAFGKRRWGKAEVGLALSRKLVEKMGGQIRFEHAPRQGSTLWFTAVFRKQGKAAERSSISPQILSGQRILVVDDNPATQQPLLEQLQSWGSLPEAAGGSSEALVKLCQAAEGRTPYALAVLSREMEEMDGITLAQEIRRAPALAQTLLVMIASQGNRGEGKLMQDMGVSAYLTRPVKSSHLRDCLALTLSRKQSPEKLPAAPLITRYFLAEEKKRRVRVLVASEDRHVQKVALQTLQKIGYGADVVPRPDGVLEALAKGVCDLVLLDLDFPGTEGMTAVDALRRQEKQTGGRVPIVGLAPKDSQTIRPISLPSGLDDYILKPVQAIDLADVLDRFLSEGE